MINHNLLLVDDHLYFRKSTISLLREFSLFNKIWEANSAIDAIECIRTKKINLVLLDARLHQSDGLDVMDYIRKYNIYTPVIAITSYGDIANLLHIARSGIRGILLKSELNPEELKMAIKNVMDGHLYFADSIRTLIEENIDVKDIPAIRLTERETALLNFLANGCTSHEISGKLNITLQSAETYRKRLFEKTKTDSLPELIAFGFRNGILH